MSLLHDAVKKASQTKQETPSVDRPISIPSQGRTTTPVRRSWGTGAVLVCIALALAAVAYRQSAQVNALQALDIRLGTLASEIARLQGDQSDAAGLLSGVRREVELVRGSLDGLSQDVERASLQAREAVSTARAGETRLGRLERTLTATRTQLESVANRLSALPAPAEPSEFVPATPVQQTAPSAA